MTIFRKTSRRKFTPARKFTPRLPRRLATFWMWVYTRAKCRMGALVYTLTYIMGAEEERAFGGKLLAGRRGQ